MNNKNNETDNNKLSAEKINEANKKLDELDQGPIKAVFNDFRLLPALIKDYSKGNYIKLPGNTILATLVAIIYFIVPTDLIPDILLGFGQIDDTVVIAFALRTLHKDLQRYKLWKEIQENEEESLNE